MSFLMNSLAFLFDVRVEPFSATNTIGIVAGVVFFLVFAAIAIVAFFIVKRTVKMAVRMAIVAAILAIAIVGGISFWMFTSNAKPATRPTNPRNR
jgi:apolipoprotein N-acyltransferase